MSATLHLRRETTSAMELRRATFHVVVDGDDVGTIERHQTFELAVEAGAHRLKVTEGRYSSAERPFVVGDGDVASFLCNGARLWPVYVASLVKTDLALVLREE